MLCGNAKHTGCENRAEFEVVIVDELDQEARDELGLTLPFEIGDTIEHLCGECSDDYISEHLELFECEILARDTIDDEESEEL